MLSITPRIGKSTVGWSNFSDSNVLEQASEGLIAKGWFGQPPFPGTPTGTEGVVLVHHQYSVVILVERGKTLAFAADSVHSHGGTPTLNTRAFSLSVRMPSISHAFLQYPYTHRVPPREGS